MAWAPDYLDVTDLGQFLRVDDSIDVVQYDYAISAASRAVDKAANRQFGQTATAEARYYTAEWDRKLGRWFATIDDLMVTPTGVGVDPVGDESFTGNVGTSYTLLERNAAAKGRPWTRMVFTGSTLPEAPNRLVKITAQWGWNEVPMAVVQATALQASRLIARRDAPFGVAGSPTMGTEIRLLSRLDPDLMTSIRPYMRIWGAR